MILLLDSLFLVLLVGLAPVWLVLLALRPNLRASIIERFRQDGPGQPLQDSIWLHGSSAGEIDLLKPLVAKLERSHPGVPIVVSAFAISGYIAARKAFGSHRVIFLPAEFSPRIRRAIRTLDPRLVVLVESELWPNLMLNLARAGVPVCLLNGKMSEKSLRSHRRFGVMARAVRTLAVVAVQTAEHAERFRALGAEPAAVHVTGNMKYDLTPVEDGAELRAGLRARYGVGPDTPLVIAGSIHSGEDAAVAEAASRLYADGRDFRLVVVPRYPADAGDMAAALARFGLDAVRKSELDGREASAFGDRTVLVVDTMGELKRFYAMSDIAYVGGSLHFRGSNKGGHNLMEPAIFGVAVLFGPYNLSFKETARDMLDDRAGFLVRDSEELYTTLGRLLDDRTNALDAGARARNLVIRNQGATRRNHELILPYLPKPDARTRAPAGSGLARHPASEDNGGFVQLGSMEKQ